MPNCLWQLNLFFFFFKIDSNTYSSFFIRNTDFIFQRVKHLELFSFFFNKAIHAEKIICIKQFKSRSFFTTLLRMLICLLRPGYSYDNLAKNLATFLSKTTRKQKK